MKNRILEIMEKSGLTPSEFADKIEVQRSAISHITSGRNNPSLDFMIKIKTAFPEIDTDWLIFGIEKKEVSPEKITLESKPKTSETLTLFDDENLDSGNQSEIKDTAKNQSNPQNPDKVILLYTDGTFESFVPGKK